MSVFVAQFQAKIDIVFDERLHLCAFDRCVLRQHNRKYLNKNNNLLSALEIIVSRFFFPSLGPVLDNFFW